jgi:hypothetical protein
MANDLHTGSEAGSLTGLLTGIVNDIQALFKQQLALLKHEVRKDVRDTATAGASCVAGAAVCAVGAMLLGFGLVHLLAWGADLPLWASFLIFAAVFLVTGGILVFVGAHKFTTFNPLPDETAEALKENVQSIMKPK